MPRFLNREFLWGALTWGLVLLFLAFGFFGSPEVQANLSSHSNIVLAAVTVIYAWLTYKILRFTIQGRSVPYLKADFLCVSKFDDDFIEKYDPIIKKNPLYTATLSDFKSNPKNFSKNAVFARVQNIGDKNAIECRLDISYEKRSLGQKQTNMASNLTFGVLGVDTERMELVEVYDRPTQSDSFLYSKIILSYKDVGGKLNSGAGVTSNFTEEIISEEASPIEITIGPAR